MASQTQITMQQDIINNTSADLKETSNYFKLTVVSKTYRSILNIRYKDNLNTTADRNDVTFKNGKILGAFRAAQYIDDQLQHKKEEFHTFEATKRNVASEKLHGNDQLLIRHNIQRCIKEIIGQNESGLSTSVFLHNFSENSYHALFIKTQYTVSSHTQKHYTRTSINNPSH